EEESGALTGRHMTTLRYRKTGSSRSNISGGFRPIRLMQKWTRVLLWLQVSGKYVGPETFWERNSPDTSKRSDWNFIWIFFRKRLRKSAERRRPVLKTWKFRHRFRRLFLMLTSRMRPSA